MSPFMAAAARPLLLFGMWAIAHTISRLFWRVIPPGAIKTALFRKR